MIMEKYNTINPRVKQLLFWAFLLAMPLLLSTCEDEPEKPSEIIKIELSEPVPLIIAYERADFSTVLNSDGPLNGNLIDRGFCWSTNPNPDLSQSSISLGRMLKPGSFSAPDRRVGCKLPLFFAGLCDL